MGLEDSTKPGPCVKLIYLFKWPLALQRHILQQKYRRSEVQMSGLKCRSLIEFELRDTWFPCSFHLAEMSDVEYQG